MAHPHCLRLRICRNYINICEKIKPFFKKTEKILQNVFFCVIKVKDRLMKRGEKCFLNQN